MSEDEITSGFDTERHPPRVVFDEFAGGAPSIKVYYWFNSADPWAYAAHAERINLRVARSLAAMEIRLA